MSDPRLTLPERLQGAKGTWMRCGAPLTDLCRAPGGPRDCQLLYGHDVQMVEDSNGWSLIRMADGYVGHVVSSALIPRPHRNATHRVTQRLTHGYTRPEFKSPERVTLSIHSHLSVEDTVGSFAKTDAGFVPLQHLTPVEAPARNPVDTARALLGTPYLWGGNSGMGIDCSGLVQQALFPHMPFPRDSDMQEAAFDKITLADVTAGDLIFWKGHVGMMVDSHTLIHANAHHMAVATEPLAEAIARISQKEFGAVTSVARPGTA